MDIQTRALDTMLTFRLDIGVDIQTRTLDTKWIRERSIPASSFPAITNLPTMPAIYQCNLEEQKSSCKDTEA